MKISEMIKILEELKQQYGDIKIVDYNEEYDCNNENLWVNVTTDIHYVVDDEGHIVERTVEKVAVMH